MDPLLIATQGFVGDNYVGESDFIALQGFVEFEVVSVTKPKVPKKAHRRRRRGGGVPFYLVPINQLPVVTVRGLGIRLAVASALVMDDADVYERLAAAVAEQMAIRRSTS